MASVVVGATLTECIYTAVSVTALSNFMIHENWDSRHSRLQTLAAFAERFRNQGLDSYVSNVFGQTGPAGGPLAPSRWRLAGLRVTEGITY